ncbi:hypothetical protein FA95DRAFT_264367 [Auriscalpium vulgare]|uniref:Uncharacterized protein n=1 Tax=Auriscalpium vulgare TaxID=40419 RepID=A0ACB8RJB6_9AGAM|nr:hypothetical protein FA95DRAFT_264367 [Auriscalpium vulgare]
MKSRRNYKAAGATLLSTGSSLDYPTHTASREFSAAMSPMAPMVNMASTTAPILFGSLGNWCLYGALVLQVYMYNLSFPDDRKFLKFLVYGIFAIETVQTALNGVDMYHWFGSGWGHFEVLLKPQYSPMNVPFVSGIVTFSIQVFFCHRISTLNKSLWWLTILISMISLLQAIGGIGSGIQGFLHPGVEATHAKITETLVYLWLLGDAVADVLIATSMTTLLLRARNPHHPSSHRMISRLVRLTIETNIVSASVAVTALILYAAVPAHPYFFVPSFIISKIYSNTLLVTLNNRTTLRRIEPDGSQLHISHPDLPMSSTRSAGQIRPSKRLTEAASGPMSDDVMPDPFKARSLTDETTPDVIRLTTMGVCV